MNLQRVIAVATLGAPGYLAAAPVLQAATGGPITSTYNGHVRVEERATTASSMIHPVSTKPYSSRWGTTSIDIRRERCRAARSRAPRVPPCSQTPAPRSCPRRCG